MRIASIFGHYDSGMLMAVFGSSGWESIALFRPRTIHACYANIYTLVDVVVMRERFSSCDYIIPRARYSTVVAAVQMCVQTQARRAYRAMFLVCMIVALVVCVCVVAARPGSIEV